MSSPSQSPKRVTGRKLLNIETQPYLYDDFIYTTYMDDDTDDETVNNNSAAAVATAYLEEDEIQYYETTIENTSCYATNDSIKIMQTLSQPR